MSDDAPLRIGLVGCGGVGARHARTLAGFDDVRLVGVCDAAPDLATALGAEVGAEVAPDAGALVAGHDLDAVYVCVPPGAHGEPERLALDRGLALFVEKPVGLDLAAVVALERLAAERGVVTQTGYHWRHLDTVATARAALAERPPQLVAARWVDKVPPPAWWLTRTGSGGQLVEQTTHVLDLARHLVGEVEEVTALGVRLERPTHPAAEIDSHAVGLLRFAGGAIGTVSTSSLPVAKHVTDLEVVADRLVVGLSEDALRIADEHGDRTTAPTGDARVACDRAFVDAVRGVGPPPLAPYAEAVRSLALSLALTRSAERGGVPVRPDALLAEAAA